MTVIHTTQQTESNYDRFIAELTALTRKYGVAIQSVGGVYLADERGEYDKLTYTADITMATSTPISKVTELRQPAAQEHPA
jgi:hypothetical protein